MQACAHKLPLCCLDVAAGELPYAPPAPNRLRPDLPSPSSPPFSQVLEPERRSLRRDFGALSWPRHFPRENCRSAPLFLPPVHRCLTLFLLEPQVPVQPPPLTFHRRTRPTDGENNPLPSRPPFRSPFASMVLPGGCAIHRGSSWLPPRGHLVAQEAVREEEEHAGEGELPAAARLDGHRVRKKSTSGGEGGRQNWRPVVRSCSSA
jgi:hypothetical protein